MFDAKISRLPSGCHDGAKFARPELRHLAEVAAVAIHHVQLELRRAATALP